jgi:hypothetical protein
VTALALPPVRGRNRSKPNAQKATPQLLVNAIQFCAWVGQASAGDKLEYHRGLLAMDAGECSQSFEGHRRRELNRVARRAWWAAEQGLIHLLQRRNGIDDFSYIAIARPRPKELSATLSSVLLKEVA